MNRKFIMFAALVLMLLMVFALNAGITVAKTDGSMGYKCSSCHPGMADKAAPAAKAATATAKAAPAKAATAKTTTAKTTTAKATAAAPKPTAKPAPTRAEVIYKEWDSSKHSEIIEEGPNKANWPNVRAGSYNCGKCHAEEGFIDYIKEVKAAGGFDTTFSGKYGTTEFKNANITIKPFGGYTESKAVAGCNACHENGKLRITGVVGLQTTASAGKPGYDKPLMKVNAGKAAACFICHDYRKNPSFPAKIDNSVRISAPHAAAQTQLLLGFGGAEVAGERYGSSPHTAIPDSCVTCHMAKSKNGLGDHTFAVALRDKNGKGLKSNLNACTSCHPGLNTINRLSLGDYDGDKAIEGIQDEVKGLVHVLEELIAEKLEAPNAKAVSSGGQINIFKDGAHTDIADPSTVSLTHKVYKGAFTSDPTAPYWTNPDAQKIFNAMYNIFLVEKEGSWGIHNPVYAVQLLQQSYKDLAGHDVPGARIR